MKAFFTKAFNLASLQANRMAWVDYLKGIAIVLVVYRHALLGIERSGVGIPLYLEHANMIFYSFRMPLFFLLSGIFISSSLSKKSLVQLVRSKFNYLLYPYLIWSFLQVSLQILLSSYANSNRSWIDYTYIFYQPRSLDQFWYLPALFNATVVYVFLKEKLKAPVWLQLALGLLFYFTAHYFEAISMISDWMKFYLFFALGDALSNLFFTNRAQRWLNNPYSLLAIIPFFILSQIYYVSHPVTGALFLVIAFIGCVCMLLVSFQLQRFRMLAFLRVLGYHSLYIYAMHVIVIAFSRELLANYWGVQHPILLLGIGIVAGLVLPVVCYNLFIYQNVFWFLFSPRKPRAAKPVPEPVSAPAPAPAAGPYPGKKAKLLI